MRRKLSVHRADQKWSVLFCAIISWSHYYYNCFKELKDMAILLDRQLREYVPHNFIEFPITYFYDELVALPDSLPFIVFRHSDHNHRVINSLIKDTYRQMNDKQICYELAVQRNICCIFEYISRNFVDLPKTEATRIQINSQIRLQKMMTYIYENYAEPLTLEKHVILALLPKQYLLILRHFYL